MYEIWWIGVYRVSNSNSTFALLKTFLLFGFENKWTKTWAIFIFFSSSFLGGLLPLILLWTLVHFFLFYSHMPFSAYKIFERDCNKKLEHLFRGCPIGNIFGVFSQCRSKTFLGGSRWNVWCLSQCRNSAYIGGVYVILILKAWQVSKGQQSLTKLNANISSKYLSGFPILACMAVVGI